MEIINSLIEKRDCGDFAIVSKDCNITYRQLYTYAQSLAQVIRKNVSNEEANVGLCAKNDIDYIIGYYAILFAGKTVVPLKSDMLKENMMFLLNKAKTNWVVISENMPLEFENQIYIKRNEINNNTEVDRKAGKDILLISTTGTTSKQKLVRINSKNLSFVAEAYINMYHLYTAKNVKYWILIPLQSSYGNFVFVACIMAGVTIYINNEWHPWEFRRLIIEEKITHVECISSFAVSLLKMNNQAGWGELRSFGFGGEGIGRQEFISIFNNFNKVTVSQGYGLSEASPLITMFPPEVSVKTPQKFLEKISSVGKVIPGVEVKILKDEDEKTGEILVKGPNVSEGYFGDSSEGLFYNQYLRTGDIGFLDDEGYLYISGRKKNIAIIEGRNIQIEEVENAIKLFPIVEDVRVYSIKDEFSGESLCAEIVISKTVDENELNRFLSKKLENYKIPKKYIVVEQIKRIGGKISRQ